MAKRSTRGQSLMEGMFDDEESLRVLKDELDDDAFQRVDDDLDTDYRCPYCGYEWSGQPKPSSADLDPETDA